jgi:DNA-directed RNA polymerase specialized sigma24 family protein
MGSREVSLPIYDGSKKVHHSRPVTEIQALMEAVPFEEPEESIMELQPFREAMANCMDKLDGQDLFIIEAVVIEQISLQELGHRLGITKTHAWRLRNAAFERLKVILMENDVISKRMESLWTKK